MRDTIPTAEEILITFRSMGSTKAPGPDGLSVLFFCEYWGIISSAVIATVQDFFNSGRLLRTMNHTFIVLIPKVVNPHRVTHYRLISLCNVCYKVISKIIATPIEEVSAPYDFCQSICLCAGMVDS